MASARLVVEPVADLRRRLARRAATSPSALRQLVLRWWTAQGLAEHPAAVGLRIALALIAEPRGEPKQAGILVLHELLADHLVAADLAAFAALFSDGALADASMVDSFAVKVLGTMLSRVRGRSEVARVLAAWRDADTAWQRRAALVAFTVLAPQGDAALPHLGQLICTMCSTVVWSPERVDQTAVGWLLSELSRAEPARVEAFFRRHARFMSGECARQVIEKLPAGRQDELLAHWERATTLRH